MNLPATIGIRVLEVLFLGGCVGPLIVVAVAGVEDCATIITHKENEDAAVARG